MNQPYTYNQIGNTYRTRDNNITEYNRYGQKVGIYRKTPSGTVSTRYYRYGNRPQGYHNFR